MKGSKSKLVSKELIEEIQQIDVDYPKVLIM